MNHWLNLEFSLILVLIFIGSNANAQNGHSYQGQGMHIGFGISCGSATDQNDYFEKEAFNNILNLYSDPAYTATLNQLTGATLFLSEDYLPVLSNKQVNPNIHFGLEFGRAMSSSFTLSLQLMLGSTGSKGTFDYLTITEDPATGSTGTIQSAQADFNAEWKNFYGQVEGTYFFNDSKIQIGASSSVRYNLVYNIKESVSFGTGSLELETRDANNSMAFAAGPVVQFNINSNFFLRTNFNYSIDLSDNNYPTNNLTAVILCGYAFGQGDDQIPDVTFNEESSGPVNKEMQEELERRKRIRERMMQGQQEAMDRQEESASAKEAEKEFDPSKLEETAGHLQAQFFHAVKNFDNADSLMREFRKLSAEEGQKIVDALYAASRAASAEYWEDVARHNREYKEAYDAERAKFREEFAREWGSVQWQFLEPMIDPAGAALTLAENAGLIDSTAAEAIRLATSMTGPGAMLMRGVKNGAKKLMQRTMRQAQKKMDDATRAAGRTTDDMARSTIRQSDNLVRGSLRTVEASCGIARRHAEKLLEVARKRKWTLVIRKGNPKSLRHHCDPDYIAKPVTCKAKTAKFGPQAGTVVDPTNKQQIEHWGNAIEEARKRGNIADDNKLKNEYTEARKTWKKWLDNNNGQLPRGYTVNESGEVLYRNKKMHGDYDLHGVFSKADDGRQRQVRFGDGTLGQGKRHQDYLNEQLGSRQCRHGAQEEWIRDGIGVDADPPVVVFTPDGKIIELETKDAMRQFYRENSIRIPDSWNSGN